MAIRYAIANGNWSSTATWNGGTLPAAGDDVFAGGFTVAIDQDVTVSTLRRSANASAPTVAAGGGFTINSTRTVTLTGTDVGSYSGSTPGARVTVSGSGVVTFNAANLTVLNTLNYSYITLDTAFSGELILQGVAGDYLTITGVSNGNVLMDNSMAAHRLAVKKADILGSSWASNPAKNGAGDLTIEFSDIRVLSTYGWTPGGPLSSQHVTFTLTSSESLLISGSIANPIRAINGANNTLDATFDLPLIVNTGASSVALAVTGSGWTSTITVNGDVNLMASGHLLDLSGPSAVTLNGDHALSGSGSIINSTSDLAVTLIGSASSSATGRLINHSGPSIAGTIIGDLKPGTSAIVQVGGTGNLHIEGDVRAGLTYGVGGSGTATITVDGNCYCGGSAPGDTINSGVPAVVGLRLRPALFATTVWEIVEDETGVRGVVVSPIPNGMPLPADVRAGKVYGHNMTGTLAIPSAATVMAGVETDDTIGTLPLATLVDVAAVTGAQVATIIGG